MVWIRRVRTASGAIFAGANIENQSFPEGWCAETTAIGHMIMAAKTPEDRVIVEVVVAGELSVPLGFAMLFLQALAEIAKAFRTDWGAHVEGLLAPLPPHCALVTVIDGHPATLSWLGAVQGHRTIPLGVEHFGQTGTIGDLYRHYGIDARSIARQGEALTAGRPTLAWSRG